MTFFVKSYASFDEKSELKPYDLERRDVADDDVAIKITHAGICHSDMHAARGDWGPMPRPLVPGHEIVGVVEKTGKDVSKFKVGQIVAVGCLVDSCGKCEQCVADHEMFCHEGMIQTYGSSEGKRFPGRGTAGGYSQKIVVQQKFVLTIPDALQTPELLPGVAPILCAGITTYSPLRQFNVTKGTKVAIVGLGGLGHMGVKLAHAMGAEVTVISRSHNKDERAKKLGAHKVVASSSEEERKAHANYFDVMLDTIPYDHDVNTYIPMVKPYGTIVMIGHIGMLQKSVNTAGMIFGNKRMAGSVIGGIKETQELLDLCGEHKVIADFQTIKMEQVNEAWKELEKGDNANRFIIDVEKFQ